MAKKIINENCPCTYPGCPRHGDCEACRNYHHSKGGLTACEKLDKSKN